MTLKFFDDGSGNSYTAMGVPVQLSTSSITSSSADLTLPTGVPGAKYYELSESTNGGSSWDVVDSAIPAASIVSPATYSRSGLTSGVTYQWRLRARFASLVSPVYSAVRSVVTISSSGTGIAFTYSAPNGVAHGNTITITPNSGYTIPQRTNVKPLYVHLSDGLPASNLGRITTNIINTGGVYKTSAQLSSSSEPLPPGSIPGSIQIHVADLGQAAAGPVDYNSMFTRDYIERYYDFDFWNTANWGSNGGVSGINLKTNRYWAADSSGGIIAPDMFCDYTTFSGKGTSGFIGPESTDGTAAGRYFGADLKQFSWSPELHLTQQSSALGVTDGYYRLIRNNVMLNPNEALLITRNSTYPTLMSKAFLDQFTGSPWPVNFSLYFGFRVFDDEPPGIFIGDAATQSACTNMVPQPQTSWPTSATPNASISAQLIESQVSLSSGYLYVMKGVDASGMPLWLSTDGVKI